jgi:hypothetical protein
MMHEISLTPSVQNWILSPFAPANILSGIADKLLGAAKSNTSVGTSLKEAF